MNRAMSTDELLSAWFESEAPTAAPDALVEDVLRATARIRPQPTWLARRMGRHVGPSPRALRDSGDRRRLLAVALSVTTVGGLLAYGAGAFRSTEPPAPGWLVVAADARAGPALEIELGVLDVEFGPGPWELLLVRDGAPPELLLPPAAEGVERSCPAFSPDGQWFVHLERRPDASSDVVVWSLDAAGRPAAETIRRPTGSSPDAPASCAQWSSDSRSLAYTSPDEIGQHDLVVVDLDQNVTTFNPLPNTTTTGGFAWSPTARTIAYVDRDLWLVPVDGGEPTLLLEGTPEETIDWLSWAPDGAVLDVGLDLFQITRDPGSTDFIGSQVGSEVRRMALDGTTEQIPVGIREGEWPTVWSPDGTLIASFTDEGAAVLRDRAGTEIARSGPVAEGVDGPIPLAWSPDSQRLVALVSVPDAGSQLVLLSRDLEVVATLTPPTRAFSYTRRDGVAWPTR